jgi:hypothetical protein
MSEFNIPIEDRNNIIRYCYSRVKDIKAGFLELNGIKPCIFIEVLYDLAVHKFMATESYKITDTEMQLLFTPIKNSVEYINDFIAGNNELVAISDNDHLVFNIRRKIT